MVISPFSAVNSLVLLSQVDNGTTIHQLRSRFNFTASKSDLLEKYVAYQQSLTESARNATIILANRLFVHQGYQVDPKFTQVASNKLLSGVQMVNFTNSTAATKIINDFVPDDVIKPGTFNADTKIVLLNTIYMKLTFDKVYQSIFVDHYWYNYFSTEQANKDTYYQDIEYVIFDNGWFNYAELNDLHAQAIEIRFADSGFSLLLILPELMQNFSTLETELKNYKLSKIIDRLKQEKVYVRVPTFQIKNQINLKDMASKVCVKKSR